MTLHRLPSLLAALFAVAAAPASAGWRFAVTSYVKPPDVSPDDLAAVARCRPRPLSCWFRRGTSGATSEGRYAGSRPTGLSNAAVWFDQAARYLPKMHNGTKRR